MFENLFKFLLFGSLQVPLSQRRISWSTVRDMGGYKSLWDVSLILMIWIYLLFCLIHLQNFFFIESETWYPPKCIRKYSNKLNRAKDISISLRKVIGLSQWFITPCLWLHTIITYIHCRTLKLLCRRLEK